MGCGTSRNDVINKSPSENPKPKSMSDKSNNSTTTLIVNNGSSTILNNDSESLNSNNSGGPSETSTAPANDFYQNNLLSGETESIVKPLGKNIPPLKPPRSKVEESNTIMAKSINKKPEPIAFEIGGDEDNDSSLVKKHPPRRLRKTIDEQVILTEPLTHSHELLEGKIQQATERRNQSLHQRVASARQTSGRLVSRTQEKPLLLQYEPIPQGNRLEY